MKNSRSAAMKTSSCGRRIGHGAIMPHVRRAKAEPGTIIARCAGASCTKRWSPARAGILVALCVFAVLGWQGVTTVGQTGRRRRGRARRLRAVPGRRTTAFPARP